MAGKKETTKDVGAATPEGIIVQTLRASAAALRAMADSQEALAALYGDVDGKLDASTVTGTAAGSAPKTAKQPTADEVKNIAMKVVAKHGRDRVREVMTEVLGKDSAISEVPEDKRAAVITALTKAEAADKSDDL